MTAEALLTRWPIATQKVELLHGVLIFTGDFDERDLKTARHTYPGWTAAPEGGEASPYLWVEEALARGTAFMSSHGLVHFDAHFDNVLTDGRLLYFADFGLALSSGFELSAAEAEFLSDHLAYDRCHAMSHLLRRHLPDGLRGGMEHEAFLRKWIAGHRPDGLPREITTIVDRHARAAAVMGEFARRLLTESKQTPFPAAEIGRAWSTEAAASC